MIGVFDSGIGGLTLLHELTCKLPHEDFIYYADVDNVPYSYKTTNEILEYVEEAILYLRKVGCKAIVIACNSATNVAIEYFREKYEFPIIAIQPAIKVASDYGEDHKRILVAATPITLNAKRYQNLIATLNIGHRIDNLALPKLVEYAENGVFGGAELEAYLIQKMGQFDNAHYHYVVLGCTHFTFYEKLMQQLFAHLVAVDGNMGTARQVKRVLKKNNLLKTAGSGFVRFIESGETVIDMKKYLKLLIKLRT